MLELPELLRVLHIMQMLWCNCLILGMFRLRVRSTAILRSCAIVRTHKMFYRSRPELGVAKYVARRVWNLDRFSRQSGHGSGLKSDMRSAIVGNCLVLECRWSEDHTLVVPLTDPLGFDAIRAYWLFFATFYAALPAGQTSSLGSFSGHFCFQESLCGGRVCLRAWRTHIAVIAVLGPAAGIHWYVTSADSGFRTYSDRKSACSCWIREGLVGALSSR